MSEGAYIQGVYLTVGVAARRQRISTMSIMRIAAIMSIMSIMAVKSKVRCILSYGCRKNEFPGKRYNASNLIFT